MNQNTTRRIKHLLSWLVMPLIVIALFIIFKKPIETIVEHVLIGPLFGLVTSELPVDIAVVVVIFSVLGSTRPKIGQGHQLSKPFLQIVLITLVIYTHYRVASNTSWELTGFHVFSKIKYLDSLFLLIAYPVIHLVNAHKTGISKTKIESEFIEDEPLGCDTADDLLYAPYANKIAGKILNSHFKKSFAIGITGAWGSGKTSFMDLIKRQLNDDNLIVVDFNAWSSHDSKSLTKDFFAALRESLNDYHYSIGSKIENYANALMNNYDGKLLGGIFRFGEPKTLKQQFDSINEMLDKTGKRIILFIDDLDRLDNEELLEVLKLIRNTASFKNVVFVAAYDRGYLTNSVKNLNAQNSNLFAEKIFQIEISLPHFDIDIVRKKLFSNLVKKSNPKYHQELEDLIVKSPFIYRSKVDQYIVTMRDVVRFTNSFSLNLNALEGEIVLEEFFNLELLHYRFPGVYELLYRQKNRFFEREKESYEKAAYRFMKEKRENEEIIVFYSYLMDNRESLHITPTQVDDILKLTTDIFPLQNVYRRNNEHLSVRYPHNFDRYFAMQLFQSSLSEEEFNQARTSGKTAFKNYIDKIIEERKSYPLELRIKEHRIESREDFEIMIEGLFLLAKKRNAVSSDIWKHLHAQFEDVAKHYYQGDIETMRTFMLVQFEKATYPFLSEAKISKEFKAANFAESAIVLKTADYESINTQYFQAVVKEPDADFNTVWSSLICCLFKGRRNERGGYVSGEYIIPAVKPIMIDYIRNGNLHDFIHRVTLIEHRSEKQFCVWNKVEDLFESWAKFEEFINQFDDSSDEVLQEFKDFFQEFKKKEFKVYVDYEFEYLKPR